MYFEKSIQEYLEHKLNKYDKLIFGILLDIFSQEIYIFSTLYYIFVIFYCGIEEAVPLKRKLYQTSERILIGYLPNRMVWDPVICLKIQVCFNKYVIYTYMPSI